jgi:hypothetical protein
MLEKAAGGLVVGGTGARLDRSPSHKRLQQFVERHDPGLDARFGDADINEFFVGHIRQVAQPRAQFGR